MVERLRCAATAAIFILCFLLPAAAAGENLSERWYTERWCALEGGRAWVRMADGGRCDCLTPRYAVEVARAGEWADAIGWSLRSAMQTGKKAGIVLIQESAEDAVHRGRLDAVIERYRLPIKVWGTSRGARPAD